MQNGQVVTSPFNVATTAQSIMGRQVKKHLLKPFPTLDTWSTVSAVCLTYKDD
uniref:Uncharacterized protein n=1 Tax=Erpetoichthys calabaricus TaxID=27687 RepID=A0A8C4S8E6_ERPCA